MAYQKELSFVFTYICPGYDTLHNLIDEHFKLVYTLS